jgi:hypothetical protein
VTAETLFRCEGYPVEGESGSVGFVEGVETQLPFRPASASPLAPACSNETPAAFGADGTDGTHPEDALGEPLTAFQGIHAGKDSMQMIRARGKFSVGSITCGDGSTQIIQVEGDTVGSNFRLPIVLFNAGLGSTLFHMNNLRIDAGLRGVKRLFTSSRLDRNRTQLGTM